ncbi:cell wall hydrolase [Labrys monachus]|uniref:Cell wall hydrolase SleB domain-containing protein n=1 Tax=Labrys monachus TaxID=217067 RepID=A0ABU0F9C5_9HYPH|nr:cell wall hydrolase [Labrys monachus]MDQ0390749.1 hypothetical protein [Labrys monachus]
MKTDTIKSAVRLFAIALATSGLGGCALFPAVHTAQVTNERDCLARAMYFESNRSSDDGMLAVGTVVMNRRDSGRYPRSICGVVGQRVQFAPGVLSRQMNDAGRGRAYRVADAVLAGKRYPGMNGVYFFHTAGYTYPYSNMHYVAVAGGNAFYEKRRSPGGQPVEAPTLLAQADPMPAPEPAPVAVRETRKYARPVAAQPLPRLVADTMDDDGQRDALPPMRAATAKHVRPHSAQMARIDRQDDADFAPEALPPVRGHGQPAKRARASGMQVAQNDRQDADRLPEALPPLRPRGSVGEVRLAEPPRHSRMAESEMAQPAGAQFRFEQGPRGIEPRSPGREPAKVQRPRAVVAQSRAVPTVRIESVPVEADMGGLSAPRPAKPRSALEPQPLY